MTATARGLGGGVVVVLLALAVGYGVGQHGLPVPMSTALVEQPTAKAVDTDKGKILYYRNAMGLPDTSPVPKKDDMGMDYVPVYASEASAEPGTVTLSPERIQKLGVRTEIVSKRDLAHPIHAVGTVQIDETRQTVIAPRFEGWISKLIVDTTGQKIKKGDPLFECYSPQLVQIETEYLAFADADFGGGVKNGSLERLRTLAVPEEEISRLQKEKKVSRTIIVRALADGAVLSKQAVEGMKFAPGDTLYQVADLSNVWVIVDVYEQDLERAAIGQEATISINALPREAFTGKVGFIYPSINKDSRTAKVRVDLPNPNGLLRTDMYAGVEIAMPSAASVIAVPASAILNSGETQMILVERGDGVFQPHPVKTGAQGDGYVEILEGVSEGDRIVTSANFLIDAESNLRAALQSFTVPDAGAKQ
jgi:Cu(I)/Ag(I) efflux system membrane fusion protein